jgi:hypothetical protein
MLDLLPSSMCRSVSRSALLVLGVALLAACSGGGGSNAPDAPTLDDVPDTQATNTNADPLRLSLTSIFTSPPRSNTQYSASSSAPDVATASVDGTELVLTPEGEGIATITATAKNDGGTVEAAFDLEVLRPILVDQAIPDQSYSGDDGPASFDLSGVFDVPSGVEITYSGSSSDPSVITASVSGTTLTVDPQAAGGTATVEVVASHRGDETDSTFGVEVFAGPPPRP